MSKIYAPVYYIKYNKNPECAIINKKSIPEEQFCLPDKEHVIKMGPIEFTLNHYETCTTLSLSLSIKNNDFPDKIFVARSDYSDPLEYEKYELNNTVAVWLDESNIIYAKPNTAITFEGLKPNSIYRVHIGFVMERYYTTTVYIETAYLLGKLTSIGVKDIEFSSMGNRDYPVIWYSDHNESKRTIYAGYKESEYIDHIGEMNIYMQYKDMPDSVTIIPRIPIYAHWRDTEMDISGTTCTVLPIIDIYNEAVIKRLKISISLQDIAYDVVYNKPAKFSNLRNNTEYDVSISVSLDDAKSTFSHRMHTYGITSTYVKEVGSNKLEVILTQHEAWYKTFTNRRHSQFLHYEITAISGDYNVKYTNQGVTNKDISIVTLDKLIPNNYFIFIFKLENCYDYDGNLDVIATFGEKMSDVVHPEKFEATVTGKTITITPHIYQYNWNYSKELHWKALAYELDGSDNLAVEPYSTSMGHTTKDIMEPIVLSAMPGTTYRILFEATDNDGNIIQMESIEPTTYGIIIMGAPSVDINNSNHNPSIRTTCLDNYKLKYVEGMKDKNVPQNISMSSEVVWRIVNVEGLELERSIVSLFEENPRSINTTIGNLKPDTKYYLQAYLKNVMYNNEYDTLTIHEFTTSSMINNISAKLYPTGTTLKVLLDYDNSTSRENTVLITGFILRNSKIIAKDYFDSKDTTHEVEFGRRLYFTGLEPNTQYTLILSGIDNEGNSLSIEHGSFKDNKDSYAFNTYSIEAKSIKINTKSITAIITLNAKDNVSTHCKLFKINKDSSETLISNTTEFLPPNTSNLINCDNLEHDSRYEIRLSTDEYKNEINDNDVTKIIKFRTKRLSFDIDGQQRTMSSARFTIIPTADGNDITDISNIRFVEDKCNLRINYYQKIESSKTFEYNDNKLFIAFDNLDSDTYYVFDIAITDGHNISEQKFSILTEKGHVMISNGFKFFKAIPYIFHNGRFINSIPFIRRLGKWIKTK